MDCLIETGMEEWQSIIFWDLLQCFVCLTMNHLAASVKRLETWRCVSSMSIERSVFQRSVLKSEKVEKIVRWLKRGQSTESCHVWVWGRGWQIFSGIRTCTIACQLVEVNKKITFGVFMGNSILNSLSSGRKWAAWLAKCRCANYSTDLAAVNVVRASAWSLGGAGWPSAYPVSISEGVFACFLLVMELWPSWGQETSQISLREIHSQVRHSFINSFKGFCGALVWVL